MGGNEVISLWLGLGRQGGGQGGSVPQSGLSWGMGQGGMGRTRALRAGKGLNQGPSDSFIFQSLSRTERGRFRATCDTQDTLDPKTGLNWGMGQGRMGLPRDTHATSRVSEQAAQQIYGE